MGFKSNRIEGKIFGRNKKLSIVERKDRFMGIEDRSNSIRECGKWFKRLKEESIRW